MFVKAPSNTDIVESGRPITQQNLKLQIFKQNILKCVCVCVNPEERRSHTKLTRITVASASIITTTTREYLDSAAVKREKLAQWKVCTTTTTITQQQRPILCSWKQHILKSFQHWSSQLLNTHLHALSPKHSEDAPVTVSKEDDRYGLTLLHLIITTMI